MEDDDFFQVVSSQEEMAILTVENFGKFLSSNEELKRVGKLEVLA